MTSYEVDKLAKAVAAEIVRRASTDDSLMDILYPPKLMDVREAAEYTKTPVSTIYKKVDEIPHMKVGRRLVFTDRGLIKWMKRQ